VHPDVPTNFFCIRNRFQSLCNNKHTQPNRNCSACAHEVHICAGTPVIRTDTFGDRQFNILFISLQYHLFPQPGCYIKHNLLQYSVLQQIKGLLKYESLNILHPNICILAKCYKLAVSRVNGRRDNGHDPVSHRVLIFHPRNLVTQNLGSI